MFNKTEVAVCNDCLPHEENDYDKVRAVIEKSPNMSADEVAEHADVQIDVVKRMLAQGIVAMKTASERVECGMCGAPAISVSKRLCQACLDKLNAQMLRAQSQVKLNAKPKPTSDFNAGNVHDAFHEKRRT
jgi:protein-arginine kinase activator protein McsA